MPGGSLNLGGTFFSACYGSFGGSKKIPGCCIHCRDFVARIRQQPADSLTSELLRAHETNPDELSYKEVECVIYGLSFTGHEIVCNYLSNSLLCMLPDRELWRSLCDDSALIPRALEEVLRCESPQTSWRRIATCNPLVGAVPIPAATRIFLSRGAQIVTGPFSKRLPPSMFIGTMHNGISRSVMGSIFVWAHAWHGPKPKSQSRRWRSSFRASG